MPTLTETIKAMIADPDRYRAQFAPPPTETVSMYAIPYQMAAGFLPPSMFEDSPVLQGRELRSIEQAFDEIVARSARRCPCGYTSMFTGDLNTHLASCPANNLQRPSAVVERRINETMGDPDRVYLMSPEVRAIFDGALEPGTVRFVDRDGHEVHRIENMEPLGVLRADDGIPRRLAGCYNCGRWSRCREVVWSAGGETRRDRICDRCAEREPLT